MITTKNDDKSRNSRMEFDEVYFWTNTIKDWKPLLVSDSVKELLISSWQELVLRGKILVYGFVIMPNHLHIVWEMKEPNGKESPHISFNKYTSHMFLKELRRSHQPELCQFKVEVCGRQHRFWQRDPLAVLMKSRKMAEQKIIYMHNNPIQERWSLVVRPEDYRWSSARFYENGVDEFGFLTHYADRF